MALKKMEPTLQNMGSKHVSYRILNGGLLAADNQLQKLRAPMKICWKSRKVAVWMHFKGYCSVIHFGHSLRVAAYPT